MDTRLPKGQSGRWRALCLLPLLTCFLGAVCGQIRYSIPEELEHGAFVGNIAEDLGLDLDKLSARRFRIVSGAKKQYVEVNLENGVLFVNERIDREELCEQRLSCSFHLQVVIENPLELYRAEVEISDINDNSPSFPWTGINLDISESAAPGSRFPLESAQDLDIGTNSLRTYLLSVNKHFLLDIQTRSDGSKFAELVLQSTLDREEQSLHHVVLTAVDGGTPEKSSNVQIEITVLDANDNAPVFDDTFHRVNLAENAPKGTVVIRLNASDLDEGPNADITYSFSGHAPLRVRQLFSVDSRTGEIKVKGVIDYEKARLHEMYVQAKDKGASAVAVHCKVLVNVVDTNDNPPEVILTSVSTPVQEDAVPGTVIAVVSVMDKDSGENGRVDCEIPNRIPFQLQSSFKNYYTLVTSDFLDRETVSEYNITITARDAGSPPLITQKTILVQVSDVNDNKPRFKQPAYTVYLTENNAPGAAICSVTALDPDSGQNAYVSYSLLDDYILGNPVSTYVSINSDNGNIYAMRSFDHEQVENFQITVQAQDAGLPSQRSNVSVNVFILDQNDNSPVILVPGVQSGTTPQGGVKVPRSAEPGYLVTKISAVDADEGQNSRIFYQVLQATDPTLFGVALYTGEIRTMRPLVEKDAASHEVVILVKDNGQPALSASVSITLSVVDSLPDSQPTSYDPSLSPHHNSDLGVYVISSLSAVSVVFLLAIVVLASVQRFRDGRRRLKSRGSRFPFFGCCRCCSHGSRTSSKTTDFFKKTHLNMRLSAGAPAFPESNSSAVPPQVYCYKMCLTPESSKSDFMFLKPCPPVTSAPQNNHRGTRGLTSDWNALDHREPQGNSRAATVGTLKFSNNDWTRIQNSSVPKRYSAAHLEAARSHHGDGDDDNGYSCLVSPQYWTWRSNVKDGRASLQEQTPPKYSWTPQPHREPPDYQHNVYIPGPTCGNSTLGPALRGDLSVCNTFSTFGKKKKMTSNYEQSFNRDDRLIGNAMFN